MPEDSTSEATSAPSLSPRAIAALGATQRWARFAGVALYGLVLLKLAQGGVAIVHEHARMAAGRVPHLTGVAAISGSAISMLVFVVVYCFTAGFALRYASRLDHVRPPWRPDAHDIARALGAQHSYWRLQGVLTLVGVGLLVLGIVLVVVGIMLRAAAG